MVPELLPEALPPGEAVARARGLLVALHAGAPPLTAVLEERQPEDLTCFVGPEGGMTREERALLAAAGAVEAGLGPTVLRIEAAAAAACILAQHWYLGRQGTHSQPRSMKEV